MISYYQLVTICDMILGILAELPAESDSHSLLIESTHLAYYFFWFLSLPLCTWTDLVKI
jgi:hypothetical protein